MSESGGQGEPSMEDILASIRRILNEDGEAAAGEGGETAAAPAAGAARESAIIPLPQSTVDDIFELDQSMILEEPLTAIAPPPPPQAEDAPAAPPAMDEEPLLDAGAAAAAGASLGALVRVMGQQRHIPVYQGGPTLEDIVRQELRPLLKAWLDEHLPPMVERLVRAEIERVSKTHG